MHAGATTLLPNAVTEKDFQIDFQIARHVMSVRPSLREKPWAILYEMWSWSVGEVVLGDL